MDNYFDVLVVGAGPAGSAAALSAARSGAKVLLVEKRSKIGEPVQCAEYIPRPLAQTVKIPAAAIAQAVEGMITFMPDGSAFRKRAPGFILNRDRFDQALAENAAQAGAKILTHTKAVAKNGNGVKILGPSGEDIIQASVVIGADGPNSVVGSWIGQSNKGFVWAVQHTVVLKQTVQDTEVYMGKEYPGGYAWLFPKGQTANVGVGVRRELKGKAHTALAVFKEKIADRIGEVLAVTAGRIPVGGPLRSTDERARVILAGDAAGHTHAITGAGITQAVICGTMAGRAAALAAAGNQRAFADYRQQWKGMFGTVLEKAAEKRKAMDANWNSGNLVQLLQKCWIACKEYYYDS